MFESSVSVLSQSDLQRIHSAALEILRDVGVRVDHVRVCKALSEMGCLVEDAVVKFPERVVEEVVSKMRDPENMIDGYVGTLPLNRKRFPKDAKVVPVASGQATLAYDLVTDELRPATRQDLADACRLTNTLPGAITGHPVFIPQDAPEVLRDLAALQTSARFYPYSDFVEAYSPEIVPYFLEMGRVICNTEDELKANPPFCSWVFATPPLQFGRSGFEILFQMKDFGLRKGYGVGGVMPILGASTPLTLAGYLAMQTAETLACNVINWALLGRVSGYSAGPTILDMKLAAPSQSASEAVLLDLACMDLQRFYGDLTPIFPYALSTDAKYPDIQAGIDKTFSATVAILAGSRILSAGMGTLSLSGVGSLAQLLIDYELCQSLAHMMRSFVVDDEHIGLEMIKRVGIGGSFLMEEDTLKNLRETLYFPQLFERRMIGAWRQDRKGMLEKAKEKVQSILKKEPLQEYLTAEQVQELERIYKKSQVRLVG